jgi:hypothetical protein
MKQHIYQDGKLKVTLQSTDDSGCEIVVMPKVLVKECSMSANGFEELFFQFLKGNVSHTEAYDKAEELHETYFEKRKYSSYESFKAIKYRNHNKK